MSSSTSSPVEIGAPVSVSAARMNSLVADVELRRRAARSPSPCSRRWRSESLAYQPPSDRGDAGRPGAPRAASISGTTTSSVPSDGEARRARASSTSPSTLNSRAARDARARRRAPRTCADVVLVARAARGASRSARRTSAQPRAGLDDRDVELLVARVDAAGRAVAAERAGRGDERPATRRRATRPRRRRGPSACSGRPATPARAARRRRRRAGRAAASAAARGAAASTDSPVARDVDERPPVGARRPRRSRVGASGVGGEPRRPRSRSSGRPSQRANEFAVPIGTTASGRPGAQREQRRRAERPVAAGDDDAVDAGEPLGASAPSTLADRRSKSRAHGVDRRALAQQRARRRAARSAAPDFVLATRARRTGGHLASYLARGARRPTPEPGATRSLRARLAGGPLARAHRPGRPARSTGSSARDLQSRRRSSRASRRYTDAGEHAALWYALGAGRRCALDRRPRGRVAARDARRSSSPSSSTPRVKARLPPPPPRARGPARARQAVPTSLSFPSAHSSTSFAPPAATRALVPAPAARCTAPRRSWPSRGSTSASTTPPTSWSGPCSARRSGARAR